jgi:bifunctional DNA-binding transcriptional regulator/antitoxin component of YhaV-PrlF toxin-antitoxin module
MYCSFTCDAMISILKEFGRGQVTLPKKWREKFDTKVYIAKETSLGLLIVPFEDQTVKVNEEKLKTESESKSFSSLFKRKSIHKGG